MNARIIVDTNVFVSACLGGGPANGLLRACLEGRCQPLIGFALFAEYEDVLARESLWAKGPLTFDERHELFDVFGGVCEWTRVYFGWRPNLPDEADNHLVELAVSGGAGFIITRNLRDLTRGELQFPGLRVLDPISFMKEHGSWLP